MKGWFPQLLWQLLLLKTPDITTDAICYFSRKQEANINSIPSFTFKINIDYLAPILTKVMGKSLKESST